VIVTMQDIFPGYDEAEVLRRVAERWTIGDDDLFPLPKFEIRCPVCGSADVQARNWQFVYRDAGGAKYRCNVSFKCTVCSHVMTSGVVVPERMYKKHLSSPGSKLYHWRDAKAKLEELGVLPRKRER